MCLTTGCVYDGSSHPDVHLHPNAYFIQQVVNDALSSFPGIIRFDRSLTYSWSLWVEPAVSNRWVRQMHLTCIRIWLLNINLQMSTSAPSYINIYFGGSSTPSMTRISIVLFIAHAGHRARGWMNCIGLKKTTLQLHNTKLVMEALQTRSSHPRS